MEELEQVFNGIVKQYSERLYWHVRRMVGSHEDADDLLQEIFLKIWTALPSFHQRDPQLPQEGKGARAAAILIGR